MIVIWCSRQTKNVRARVIFRDLAIRTELAKLIDFRGTKVSVVVVVVDAFRGARDHINVVVSGQFAPRFANV